MIVIATFLFNNTVSVYVRARFGKETNTLLPPIRVNFCTIELGSIRVL